jgi:predicted dehydrogenase
MTLRFVIVGAGHMGTNHIKKILSQGGRLGARVAVVVEPDELRAKALAREFSNVQAPKIISNLGQLSEVGAKDYPDAAIVAVPASIHVETTMACLQKGLLCLVEKPLGFSALDCKEMLAQARKNQKIIHVGLLERWSLANLWGLWKPTRGAWTVNVARCGPFVPRVADTDVVHDLMIHDIDMYVLMESVFGLSPIKKIRAWGRKLRSNHFDFAIAALDLEDGGMARFFASRLSAEASRTWELTGPDWHASIDFMRRNLKHFQRVGRDMNAFEAKEQNWIAGDPLGIEIETFVKAVRGEDLNSVVPANSLFCSPEKIIPTPESVMRTHEIIDEILSSVNAIKT